MTALLHTLVAPADMRTPGPSETWGLLGLLTVGLVLLFVVTGLGVAVVTRGRTEVLLGGPHERWPLARAWAALQFALRRAAAIGTVWIAGLLFPSLQFHGGLLSWLFGASGGKMAWFPGWLGGPPTVTVDLGSRVLGPYAAAGLALAVGLLCLPFALVVFRLNAGLARVAVPARWEKLCRTARTPPLGAVWSAGRGLVLPAVGLWVAHICLATAAVLLLAGPLALGLHLARGSGNALLETAIGTLLVAVGAFLVVYLLVLQVIQQLALQSLARNRRGMASALIHAWRLMRNDPWAAVRASLGELGLNLAHALFAILTLGIGWILLLPLTGVARAIYWAQVYPELGGLGADDGVPGLAAA